MAKVIVKVTGGEAKSYDADSLEQLKNKLGLNGYTASIDGEPADDDQDLADGNFVTFSKSIKGGI